MLSKSFVETFGTAMFETSVASGLIDLASKTSCLEWCFALRLQLCSMKTNIGNAIETSGIASLIKTLHSIRPGCHQVFRIATCRSPLLYKSLQFVAAVVLLENIDEQMTRISW